MTINHCKTIRQSRTTKTAVLATLCWFQRPSYTHTYTSALSLSPHSFCSWGCSVTLPHVRCCCCLTCLCCCCTAHARPPDGFFFPRRLHLQRCTTHSPQALPLAATLKPQRLREAPKGAEDAQSRKKETKNVCGSSFLASPPPLPFLARGSRATVAMGPHFPILACPASLPSDVKMV
jgi:hypothetical protein